MIHALLARVCECGFRIELAGVGGVKAVREIGSKTLPEQLLADLKHHRQAIIRHLLAESILARASGEPVWGLVSGDPYPKQARGIVPEEWDYIAVTGDLVWTTLPREVADG